MQYHLDLPGNRIHAVDSLNVHSYVSFADHQQITFAKGILEDALKHNLQLDLTGTAVTNTEEISRLFSTGALKLTAQLTSINATAGYGCHGATSRSLRVSPHLFWPAGLCGCMEGYQGRDTQCRHCSLGFYNDAFNSSTCRPCPANSSSRPGTSSIDGCLCNVGRTGRDRGT